MAQHKDLTGTDLHVNKLHATTHQDGGTDEISLTGLAGAPLLGSATTAVTQSPADNTTKVATTAYADAAAAAAAGSYTNENAQDAVGAMVDTSLVYVDATPLLTRAALTGAVTAAQGSNTTAIASSLALPGSPTTTTQSPADNSTKIATTAYVDAAVAGGGYTDEQAQDAVGAMVDTTLVYTDATPLLKRAALTGDVTAAAGSNTTAIASDVALGGNPTTTTQSVGNSTTRIATTAFVAAAVSSSTGGGLALLEQHTASASASLDFTSWYSSTYDEYAIEVLSIITSGNVQIGFQMSTNGGSSYDTGANYDWRAAFAYSGGAGADGNTNATRIDIRGAAVTLSANGSYNGTYKLYNPASTALYKPMTGQAMFHDVSGVWAANLVAVYRSATAVNAIRLIPSSGTITSGTVRLYGIAK